MLLFYLFLLKWAYSLTTCVTDIMGCKINVLSKRYSMLTKSKYKKYETPTIFEIWVYVPAVFLSLVVYSTKMEKE